MSIGFFGDDDDDEFDEIDPEGFELNRPAGWGYFEAAAFSSFDNATDSDLYNDPVLKSLWHSAYFGGGDYMSWQRAELQTKLSQHLRDEYGLEFDDLWSWDDYREWYDNI